MNVTSKSVVVIGYGPRLPARFFTASLSALTATGGGSSGRGVASGGIAPAIFVSAGLVVPDNPSIGAAIRIPIVARGDPNPPTRRENRSPGTCTHDRQIRQQQTRSDAGHSARRQTLLSCHPRADGVQLLPIRHRR